MIVSYMVLPPGARALVKNASTSHFASWKSHLWHLCQATCASTSVGVIDHPVVVAVHALLSHNKGVCLAGAMLKSCFCALYS